MATEITSCANCDGSIGKLEKRFDWDGHPVCAGCHAKLKAADSPFPVERSILDRTKQANTKWKALKLLGVVLSLSGLVMTATAFWLGNNDTLGFTGFGLFVFGFVLYLGAMLGAWMFLPAFDRVHETA